MIGRIAGHFKLRREWFLIRNTLFFMVDVVAGRG
jgi:hypothetical protein